MYMNPQASLFSIANTFISIYIVIHLYYLHIGIDSGPSQVVLVRRRVVWTPWKWARLLGQVCLHSFQDAAQNDAVH